MRSIEFGDDPPEGLSWARTSLTTRRVHVAKIDRETTLALCGVYVGSVIDSPEHMSGTLCPNCATELESRTDA